MVNNENFNQPRKIPPPPPPRPFVNQNKPMEEKQQPVVMPQQQKTQMLQQKEAKPVAVKEPLSDQSKGILFGLLGAFCLICGIALVVAQFLL